MARLKESEALVARCATNNDRWVLRPRPIPALAKAEKRREWEQVIEKARIKLIHEKWEEALAACRELSDVGGVADVALVRCKNVLQPNSLWKDGKQVQS